MIKQNLNFKNKNNIIHFILIIKLYFNIKKTKI